MKKTLLYFVLMAIAAVCLGLGITLLEDMLFAHGNIHPAKILLSLVCLVAGGLALYRAEKLYRELTAV